MESVWLSSKLSEEIVNNSEIFTQTQNVVSDMMSGRIDITHLVENLAGVLTHKDTDCREKGMRFFTKVLKEIPRDYLNEAQIKFISKFYTDRLKDNHKVIPPVLDGYISIIDMAHYQIEYCAEFFVTLFREVPCQSQVRQDRYHIFLIIQKLMQLNVEYMKTLGPDFVYGVISAVDGERDPRNLLFLFSFLPNFLSNVPLHHLVEEMFEVVSCYFPIEFTPSPDDPAGVTRQDLAVALAPCLCATPQFADQCLVLLIEKLDSSLRLAKIDSLKLLIECCKTFKPENIEPFLKALWSSIQREITHKSDDELKMVAHEALSALLQNLATSAAHDLLENFVKGILISTQKQIAGAATVAQFVEAKRILLTTANSSKESCLIVTKAMIPALLAYYGFNTTDKLQIASLVFLGDLFDVAQCWQILNLIDAQAREIPQLCLSAVCQPNKEYQIAGFQTLTRVNHALDSNLLVPYVEVLMHNIQHSLDNDLLSVSVNTVNMLAKKFPEQILDYVIKGKCDIENLTGDKCSVEKKLMLLCNLASIDDFSKYVIERMLRTIAFEDKEHAQKVFDALSESISNSSLYSSEKISQIESDHGLIDSVVHWLNKEITECVELESLNNAFALISTTMSSLPSSKQLLILDRHSEEAIRRSKENESYFLIVESLYGCLQRGIHNKGVEEVFALSLRLSAGAGAGVGAGAGRGAVRRRAGRLAARLLNRAELGEHFERLYAALKEHLSRCDPDDEDLCPRLLTLYAWITKALVMRGSDLFMFWLTKLTAALSYREQCWRGAAAIGLVVGTAGEEGVKGEGEEGAAGLGPRAHCRVSPLYAQRLYYAFRDIHRKRETSTGDGKTNEREVDDAWLLAWTHIIAKLPKAVLLNDAEEICPRAVSALGVAGAGAGVAGAEGAGVEAAAAAARRVLPAVRLVLRERPAALLPGVNALINRLLALTTYQGDMEVRIASLECVLECAARLPARAVVSRREDTLRALLPALDDTKRRVRAAAARARARWFLLGAPGGPDDDH